MNTIAEHTAVNLINALLEEAVKNGADAGGAYNQNMESYYSSIKHLIEAFGLDENYKIVETGNLGCWSPYKIVHK